MGLVDRWRRAQRRCRLAEWAPAGAERCSGTAQRADLGCWKGLPREDTMDGQGRRCLAERPRGTMDKRRLNR